jgi:fibro-slime domain-containing protein
MKKLGNFVPASLLVIGFMTSLAFAQGFPAQMEKQVIFYDYKSNKTNTNFENCNTGLMQGMVQYNLDASKKPVFLANLACNDHLNEWFRPSGNAGTAAPPATFVYNDVSKRFEWTGVVNYLGRPNEWVAPTHNDGYSMTNIIVYDSLPFQHLGGGLYQYTNDAFFMLDGKGYGNDLTDPGAHPNHNFGFTMELHDTFTYQTGLVFNFTGDDDVWAFINGKLVMDIGGVHAALPGTVNLDTIPGLIIGNRYAFDFFYAERHTNASHIKITTNILTRWPAAIAMTTIPATDTIAAGDSMQMFAKVMDDTGASRPEYSQQIQWRLEAFPPTVPPSALRSSIKVALPYTDSNNVFYAVEAYKWYYVIASFTDPHSGRPLVDTVRIYVKPATPDHLLIEASPIYSISPNADNRLGTVTLTGSMENYSVYAILRDRFQNFVGPANPATWDSRDHLIVTAAVGNAPLGEGVITRQTAANSFTYVIANQSAMHDSVLVNLSNVNYSKIEIVKQATDTIGIDSLKMRTDQDTALFAVGRRADGSGRWDTIQATWGNSPNLTFVPSAPVAVRWGFRPSAAATGRIFIVYGSLTDTIVAAISPGLPNSVVLYPAAGQPGGAGGSPYPPATTVIAGQPFPMYAKLFSTNNEWLSAYEGSGAAGFNWTKTELTGGTNSGTLTAGGSIASFTGTTAYQVVRIFATFQGSIVDSITLTITPGPATHLVLEPDTTGKTAFRNDPGATHRAGTITIGAGSTTAPVYAVLRDQYGNFVNFSDPTLWTPRSPAIVNAAAGSNVLVGEGICQRIANSGSAWVLANDITTPAFTDSVLVVLSNISYTALRIVVTGPVRISNLTMDIDHDTILTVQGQRSDNGLWENVAGNWSATSGLKTTTPAPGTSISWHIFPTDTGSGWIKVTMGTATPDSVSVQFTPGKASYIVLYANDGTPVGHQPYFGPLYPINDTAGRLLPVVAKVFDKAGIWLSSYEVGTSPVTWTVYEFPGNNITPTGTRSPAFGYKTGFTPQRAYNSVYIIATFSENGVTSSDSIQVYVSPGPATHLLIEASPDSMVSLNADNRLGSLTFTNVTQKDSVYATLRDAFGNYVGHAAVDTWTSDNTGVVAVATARTNLGEGEITRQTINPLNTFVHATQGAMTDSVQVILNNIGYNKIEIVRRTQDTIGIDTLKMRTDQDTILYAVGRRGDGSGIWDSLQVSWGNSVNLAFNNAAPAGAYSWSFRPSTPTTGTMFIAFGSLTDTIPAVFSPGLPNGVVLYPAAGQPGGAGGNPYPASTSVTAGVAFPITAKIFSTNNEWLSGYERSDAPIAWTMTELTGAVNSGTIVPTTGFQTSFTGQKAYQTVRVTATFQGGFSASIVISIQPGPATKLVLEPDTTGKTAFVNDPAGLHRADSVVIGSTSTTAPVYAVLRDQFGNFVSFSNPTIWQPRLPAIVDVTKGNVVIGEGICERKTALGQAYVLATDSVAGANPAFTDSVRVVLSNISYTALRIVVSGLVHISSLAMDIDHDTTLIVQGQRSDNGLWDTVSGNWSATSGVKTTTPAPGTSKTWHIFPTGTGSGWIKVTMGTAAPDSVDVQFTHGKASYIVLYANDNTPVGHQPYPDPSFAWVDTAGIGLPVVAKVFDKAGTWLSTYENGTSPVTWTVVEFPANISTPTGSLSLSQGYKTVFTPQKAYNFVYIIATFTDVAAGVTSMDTIQVQVVPGPITHLVIEASPDSMISLNADNRLGSLTFTNITQKDSVYATLRDALGNYVGHATAAAWLSDNTGIVTVAAARTALGEGEITRQTINPLNTFVHATQGGMTDSVQVILSNIGYDQIQIVKRPQDTTGIDTLRMRTDQDTILFAVGRRGDGSGLWDSLQVQWGSSTGLTFNNSAPASAYSWRFSPLSAASGTIFITWGSGGSQLTDTIPVIFSPGRRNSMALYPQPGQPDVGGNTAYPPSVSVTAGVAFPIVAKIFSTNNEWLSAYEANPNDPRFVWKIDELTGAVNSGTLDKSTGFGVNFTGTKAYQSVRVTVTFTDDTIFVRSIVISILHGPASKLVLEPDTMGSLIYRNDPAAAHRAGQVNIGSTSTTARVYAVLRDQFGNFVSFSNPTTWLARKPDTVSAASGNTAVGEGIARRRANQGQAIVLAKDGTDSTLTDSVLVVLAPITYDSLRIVTGDSTVVNNILLAVEDSVKLKVQGLNSANKTWEYVNADWHTTTGLHTTTLPPTASNSWTVAPTYSGSGWIKVTMTGSVPDSIAALFTHGPARSIVLYPATGAPSAGNQPYAAPGTALVDSAGKNLPVVAKVFDKAGIWLSDYEISTSPVAWSIVEFPANASTPTGTLSLTNGYATGFLPTKAYNTVYVIASFSEGNNTYLDSIRVRVVPGPVDHLVIEADWDSTKSLNADNRLGTLTFTPGVTADSVYATLRDKNGNYIDHAKLAQWISQNSLVASVAAARTALGEGEITRHSTDNVSTYVTASQAGLKDSVQVVLSNVMYSKIQIVVRSSVPIDTLSMRTGQDTTLSAIGLQVVGKDSTWRDIQVVWASSGVSIVPTAPSNSNQWTFHPGAVGTGKIFIVWGTGATQLTDEVTAIFGYGSPKTMALYPSPGQPNTGTNTAYPDLDTVTAGVPLPLVAKLFTDRNEWLSGYERSDAPITWTITELSGATGSGTLDKYSGYQVNFTGFNATQTVKVTAVFSEGGITIVDSIKLFIKAGPAAKLVIEPDTTGKSAFVNDRNGVHRAGQVTVFGSATSVPVYAVLRDRFGNFVSFSNPTSWRSKDTASVSVKKGDTLLGEGLCIRKTMNGQAWVFAKDGKDTTLTDSVLVVLRTVYYTALRIVKPDSTNIDSLTLSLDDSMTVMVLGQRSDNQQWEFVNGNWSVTGSLSTATNPPGSSISWIVAPSDTGSGWIKVSMGTALPDSAKAVFVHGSAHSIVLYPRNADPSTLLPFPAKSEAVWDSAGTPLPVFSKIFDRAGIWLREYDTVTSPVAWTLLEDTANKSVPTGSISPSSGNATTLAATKAYNAVYIIGKFTKGGTSFSDTILVRILPGPADHLSLEPDPRMETSPNADNPADSVVIASYDSYGIIYAVIRDKYGNFIADSKRTTWQSRDSSVVVATDGQKSVGQGVITRKPDAVKSRATVVALSLEYPGLKDSTAVIISQFYYTALRIVDVNGTPITSLRINTNQDATLRVQGLRNTDSMWVDLTAANWQSSPGLSLVPSTYTASPWTISPTKPGSGTIRVTLGDTMVTKPAAIPVIFDVGPPVIMDIKILTPPELRRAGDTITAVVSIRNKDGLVPAEWCDSTAYHNVLPDTPHVPIVIGDTTVTMGRNMYECFHDGLDTVKYVLYYAPYNPAPKDSEQIWGELKMPKDTLRAFSGNFILHPGALDRIALEDDKGKHLDTIALNQYPSQALVITAMGYDAYGNKRGPEPSNWSKTGQIPAITQPNNAASIYYKSDSPKNEETGTIKAAAGPNGVVTDSVYVVIAGQTASVVSAVTQDANGNGILDRIVVVFDKKVSFPIGTVITLVDTVSGNVVTLRVTTVIGQTSKSSGTVDSTGLTGAVVSATDSSGKAVSAVGPDSVFTLVLSDPVKDAYKNPTALPQTGWKPTLTISGASGISSVNQQCSDGAGPVIWHVTKTINSPTDRTQDVVNVQLSEPIGTGGNEFDQTQSPASIFRVWHKVTLETGKDTLVEVTDKLSGIKTVGGSSIYYQKTDSVTYSFSMSNGKDVTSLDYFSLVSDTTNKRLTDKNGTPNVPNENNQKVQVYMSAQISSPIIAAPNPSATTFQREKRGEFHLANQPLAAGWVYTDRAGVVLRFSMTVTDGERVTGYLKIYDAIGNLVQSVDSSGSTNPRGIIPKEWGVDSTAYNFDIYWNGANMRGMPCAAGVYKTILVLKFEKSGVARTEKKIGTVGLR